MKWRSVLVVCVWIVPLVTYAQQTARSQNYGIAQDLPPVRSDIAQVCDMWTDARKSACKQYSEQLKKQYNLTAPFPLLEERAQSELKYRVAAQGVTPKKGELFLMCEKNTVQDSYRLTGVDDISVQEPTQKKLSPEASTVKKISNAEKKRLPDSYVLLADGEHMVKGKKGCMLERDIQSKFGKGCARPTGDGGTKEDPKTCKTGLTVMKGVPFSEESLQSIKGAGIRCFKEERGRVKKNQKTDIAEKISLATYVLCSDDAETLKRATETDKQKKEGNPDGDRVENLLAGEEAPQTTPQLTSTEYRSRVSALLKKQQGDPDNVETLSQIFEESKGFGRSFSKEATASQIKERISDFKSQLANNVTTRGHRAALYGGLCGLGEVRYCGAKIRGSK